MEKAIESENLPGHAKQMIIDYLRRVIIECKNGDKETKEGLSKLKEQIDKADVELKLLLESPDVPSIYRREYNEERQKEEYHELLGVCDLMLTSVERSKALLCKIPVDANGGGGSSQSSSPHFDNTHSGLPNMYQPWKRIISVHRKDQTMSLEEFNEFIFPSTSVERAERLMIFEKASLSHDYIIDVPTKQGWFRLHRSELGFSVSKIRLTPLQEMVVDLRARLRLLCDAKISTKEDAEVFRRFSQSYTPNLAPVYGGLPCEDAQLHHEIKDLQVKINEKWILLEEKTAQNITPPQLEKNVNYPKEYHCRYLTGGGYTGKSRRFVWIPHQKTFPEEQTFENVIPPQLQANIHCPRHYGCTEFVRLAGKSYRILPEGGPIASQNANIEKAPHRQHQELGQNSSRNEKDLKREDHELKAILSQNEILKIQCQSLQNEIILLKEKNAHLSNIEKRLVHLEKDVEIIYSIVEDVD